MIFGAVLFFVIVVQVSKFARGGNTNPAWWTCWIADFQIGTPPSFSERAQFVRTARQV
jgi:hypothetical protein